MCTNFVHAKISFVHVACMLLTVRTIYQAILTDCNFHFCVTNYLMKIEYENKHPKRNLSKGENIK